MARTIQKRIKFSKGEINPLLSERTDIDILDNSASYIKNYTPTIFGGIKTRLGTKKIDVIRNIINKIEEPTTNNLVGGNIIGDTKNLFIIKAINNANAFIRFNINDIYFNSHIDTILNIELESYEEEDTTEEEQVEPPEPLTYYRLKNLSITKAGNHYTTTPIITFTKDNLQEGEILPEATAHIDATGLLTSITINNVGKLNDNNLSVAITQPEPFNETINILDKNHNILDTFNINEEERDLNII